MRAFSLPWNTRYTQWDPICSVVFDDMSIKEKVTFLKKKTKTKQVKILEDFWLYLDRSKFVANHVPAFLVHWLTANLKQPVGYFLSSGLIKSNIIYFSWSALRSQLLDREFNELLQTKVPTITQLIQHDTGEKMYALSDPPHLKKYWKQYAEKQIFNAEWQIIWEDIVDFFELEKQNYTHSWSKAYRKAC